MMPAMRFTTITVLMVLLAAPAWSDEGPEHLHQVPPEFYPIAPFVGPTPMPADQRDAFDRAARSMYRESCKCLVYLEDGVLRQTPLPLDDRERWRLFDRILRGIVLPIPARGEES